MGYRGKEEHKACFMREVRAGLRSRKKENDGYKRRMKLERAGLKFGNSVNWDREKVIEYFLNGPSGWLGREVFEDSLDDGSMRYMAEWYDEAGRLEGL
tara:strand:+ start:668 stop:961 length:294 start_codon:yes stop_codon:yes gene_type:complete